MLKSIRIADMHKRFRSFTIAVTSFLAGIVVVAFEASGCHRAPQSTPKQAEGKHLFEVRCAHCHEENDLGLKKVPPDLHGVFTRAALPSGASATDENVKRVVLSGKGLMPPFAGRFTDEQMAALLAYLHSGGY